MKRKDFLYLTGMGFGATMLNRVPVFGSPIAPGRELIVTDPAKKNKCAILR